MDYINTLEALKQGVAEGLEPEDTLALVFLRNTFDAHDITAIKQADKWCDKVVVVGLEKNDVKRQFLEQAGCDFYYQFSPSESAVFVDCGVREVNGTHLMRSLLAVMPDAVMTPIADVSLLKALRHVDEAFSGLFTLKEIETDDDVLSDAQKMLRQQLRVVGLDRAKIEKNMGCTVARLEFFSCEDFVYHKSLIVKSFLSFVGEIDGRVWRDTIILSP